MIDGLEGIKQKAAEAAEQAAHDAAEAGA